MKGASLITQSNQWMLFGVDVRRFGHMWLSSWRDLLFANSSPIRERLDEPVLLRSAEGDRRLQGSQRISPDGLFGSQGAATRDDGQAADDQYLARLLPDDLVLTRTLALPLAVESDLPAVLSMEISACSPFSAEDTVYGFLERARDAATIHLSLAIASRSAVLRWQRDLLSEDEAASSSSPEEGGEIWAQVEGGFATIAGFGEARREEAYRKRLIRSGLLVSGILVLLLVSASLFTLQQRSKLERAERLQAEVELLAQGVSDTREVLVTANDIIRAANAVIARYPNPHLEIARLTELMGDSVYVAHFSMRGNDIRVRGRATDAAQLMQTLAETPEFAEVTAPQAITAVGNTGLEQFHLDITLADVTQPEEQP